MISSSGLHLYPLKHQSRLDLQSSSYAQHMIARIDGIANHAQPAGIVFRL